MKSSRLSFTRTSRRGARSVNSIRWLKSRRIVELIVRRSNRFLASDQAVQEVRTEEATGHRLGIRGVPYFVLNGSLAISGAQPPDIFVSALQQAEKAVMKSTEET